MCSPGQKYIKLVQKLMRTHPEYGVSRLSFQEDGRDAVMVFVVISFGDVFFPMDNEARNFGIRQSIIHLEIQPSDY